MEKIFISPQIRMLKVMLENNGEATTQRLSEELDMDTNNLKGNGRHLVGRSLATRRVILIENKYGHKVKRNYLYKLRPQKMEKIVKLVNESYGEDYNASQMDSD
jgi:predicted transcriptional regulator